MAFNDRFMTASRDWTLKTGSSGSTRWRVSISGCGQLLRSPRAGSHHNRGPLEGELRHGV